jgi:hypothetical protein
VRRAGRIAIGDSHDVETRRQADGRVGGQRLVKDLADQRGGHLGGAGEPRQMIAQRAFELGLAEDGGVQGSGKHRFGRGSGLRRLADLGPNRVHRAGFRCVLCDGAVHMALSFSRAVLPYGGPIDTPPTG